MKSGDPCPNPKCTEEIFLCKPEEYEWPDSLKEYQDRDVYDEDVEIWLCVSCGWHEAADEEEALEDHMADLEWMMGRLAAMKEAQK